MPRYRCPECGARRDTSAQEEADPAEIPTCTGNPHAHAAAVMQRVDALAHEDDPAREPTHRRRH